jgi:hypothetical protein
MNSIFPEGKNSIKSSFLQIFSVAGASRISFLLVVSHGVIASGDLSCISYLR